MNKICFVLDCHYSNYTNRLKTTSLKNFIDLKLNEYGVHFLISTNQPEDFKDFESEYIKIFDINELRKDNEVSLTYELLPDDPTGIYPSRFPWNIERFILKKAGELGFNIVINLDSDVIIDERFTSEYIIQHIENSFVENTVMTNQALFSYEENSTNEIFNLHNRYIEHFNLDFKTEEYNSLDGPVVIYMGKTSDDILRYAENWDMLTSFGYTKPLGFGYENIVCGNWSLCIPMSNFKLKWHDFPLTPHHKFEDRYDMSKVNTPISESKTSDINEPNIIYVNDNVTNDIKEKINDTLGSIFEKYSSETHGGDFSNLLNDVVTLINNKITNKTKVINNNITLYSLFEKYSCSKLEHGFSKIFEPYLNQLKSSNPSILEIGIGTITDIPLPEMTHVPANMRGWKENNPNYLPGNSLRAFRDYLNTGVIYGIDNQPDCLLNEDRIETHIFDSRSKKHSKNFIKDKSFDLIIDDGDLDPNIRIINFNNYFESLKDDGYYVILGLLGEHFLKTYFTELDIPFIIKDNNIILNKKNDFNVFNITPNMIATKPATVVEINNKVIDYSEDIKSTPMFSINDNIFAEKGFYINLDTSVNRKENVESQIEKYNIKGLLRFDALRDSMIQYSCTKSHLSVFQTCLDNNIESVFVAEDDFQIEENLYLPNESNIPSFNDKIKEVKNDLDNLEWDVFLFGCNPKTHIVPLTNNVGIINKSTGAWAYIIKKRAYEYLMKNLNYKRDYIAIDDYLPLLNDNGFITLTSLPMTIGHAIGFESTLQPRGPVNYTEWIRGSYHRFLFDNYPNNNFTTTKIEKSLTIFIPGFFCDEYMKYLRYALKSIPKELRQCKFIIRFDTPTKNYDLTKFMGLQAYFKDVRNDLNVNLTYGFGGLISSFDYFLKQVKTPYFMMFEFDYVFLNNEEINFNGIIDSFNKYNFINSIYLNGDDNSLRGFDINPDLNGNETPFELEQRVSEINLITTTRWSNRPGIHRVSKMKEWFDKYIWNEQIGVVHQSCYGVEDSMIPAYRKIISQNNWTDIKDDWGTYIYGNFNEGPFIAHTDSSRRYQGDIKTILEINAEKYMEENPLNDND